jgi:hypothetical protein
MKRWKYVCEDCGSDNCRSDAYADWNVETQQWELGQVFPIDGMICNACGEQRVEKVYVDDKNEPLKDDEEPADG